MRRRILSPLPPRLVVLGLGALTAGLLAGCGSGDPPGTYRQPANGAAARPQGGGKPTGTAAFKP